VTGPEGSNLQPMSKHPSTTTALETDCRIDGVLHLHRDAILSGRFEGKLYVEGNLELDQSVTISGSIEATNVRLSGHAEADIVAEQTVELLPGAYLSGQVRASRLEVCPGALLKGQVHIGPGAVDCPSHPARSGESRPVIGSIHHQEDSTNAVLPRRRNGRK